MSLTPEEARSIIKDAYIYGFPLVDNYRIQHSYFVDKNSPEYKCDWNTIFNNARVYTPDDKAIQTPNSDTPYSYIGADLRAEPLVITLPAVEEGRYYSVQFIDAYTFNFAYLGSRATGNGAGSYLIAGPGWKGDKPEGIKDVINSETNFIFMLIRTQLFQPDDIENVKKIQAGYKIETLSKFQNSSKAPSSPSVNFIKPLSPDQQKTSPEFFNVLNFILQYCPTHPSEIDLMKRFSSMNIGGGLKFDYDSLSPELKKAVDDGIKDAWTAFTDYKRDYIDTGKTSSADGFGTREHLKNSYIDRMCSAILGIYGNSKEEAIYPVYFVDSDHKPLDGSGNYSVTFEKGKLPPVNSFWSMTLYKLPESLLFANPLNKYLINSPMLKDLKTDADGSITMYIQNKSPGKDKESNWLPAPEGPFFCALRLYWPKDEALKGTWTAPAMKKSN